MGRDFSWYYGTREEKEEREKKGEYKTNEIFIPSHVTRWNDLIWSDTYTYDMLKEEIFKLVDQLKTDSSRDLIEAIRVYTYLLGECGTDDVITIEYD